MLTLNDYKTVRNEYERQARIVDEARNEAREKLRACRMPNRQNENWIFSPEWEAYETAHHRETDERAKLDICGVLKTTVKSVLRTQLMAKTHTQLAPILDSINGQPLRYKRVQAKIEKAIQSIIASCGECYINDYSGQIHFCELNIDFWLPAEYTNGEYVVSNEYNWSCSEELLDVTLADLRKEIAQYEQVKQELLTAREAYTTAINISLAKLPHLTTISEKALIQEIEREVA